LLRGVEAAELQEEELPATPRPQIQPPRP